MNLTWKEKEAMAQKMRHDVRTAQHKYLRVVEQTKTDKAKDDRIQRLEAQVSQLNDENETLKNQLKDAEDKLKDFKGETSQTKEWKKRRYDTIFKLNSGRQTNVKESTLENFDIKYNNETNKYY